MKNKMNVQLTQNKLTETTVDMSSQKKAFEKKNAPKWFGSVQYQWRRLLTMHNAKKIKEPHNRLIHLNRKGGTWGKHK